MGLRQLILLVPMIRYCSHKLCIAVLRLLTLKAQTYSNVVQGLHRLEKYLNLEGFLANFLKIKSALKSTGKYSKALKSP